MEVFNNHPATRLEKKGRAGARKVLQKAGFLGGSEDPREVHHANGDATDNRLINLVAVNQCMHHLMHGAKTCPSTGACLPPQEERWPSFGFVQRGDGVEPVPIARWRQTQDTS